MNGRDFLATAQKLTAVGAVPPDLRSAMSRAYYAAYHAALEYCTRCGVTFSTHSSDAHTTMPRCFDACTTAEAKDLYRMLNALRADRKTADYDLADSKFEGAANVTLRIKDAEKVIAKIDRLLQEPAYTEVRRGLRDYAKLMRFTVLGSD